MLAQQIKTTSCKYDLKSLILTKSAHVAAVKIKKGAFMPSVSLSCPKCGSRISVNSNANSGSISTSCPSCKKGITVNHTNGNVTSAH